VSDGVNKVILIGNLGADPELRMTNGGQACMTLRLATSRTFFDKNKQRQQDTQWHRVIVWGKSAEGLAKFLTKGMRIYIEGRLQYRDYEGNDGIRKYLTEVIAESTVVLTERQNGGGNRRSSSREPRYDERDPEPTGGAGTDDDDIPF
jgi:single-strand DNA-binding protein